MSEVKRTDAIAGDILHEYDGIEEADNALPHWWVAVFVGTIIFGAGYWLAYEEFHSAPSPLESLIAAQAEQKKRGSSVSDDELLASGKDPALVAAGQVTFTTTCAVCHGQKGEGNIGPNLTDDRWLHGGAPARIFAVVRDGVPEKGMPAWGPSLGDDKVKEAVAYLLSIRNTNVAGKAAEGEPWAGL